MKKHIPYIILFSAVMTSCSNKEVPPREYVRYVESPSNGLKIQQEVNGVRYELQYQPINYCVMLEKRSFSIPSEIFEQEHKRFEGLEHYSFRIDKTAMDNLVGKLGDSSKYKKSITQYFDFGIQKDIKLVEGNDTIPCGVCEIDAGIANSYTFTLGFPNKNNESQTDRSQADRYIIYENKILHTDKVALCVKGKDVKNVPGLKMM